MANRKIVSNKDIYAQVPSREPAYSFISHNIITSGINRNSFVHKEHNNNKLTMFKKR